ncbi:MAG TPA: tRNA (guanosine(37)-N1)-methyltransferase TrmD [Thermoanaerobaculia bacterium]|jgi:tRNA (guanine37-N1)-methyltransferase|nr:tRNA (guanosine(37)-N1)-methyltransferase TrmD [Thermoanaerobaculia bacterium]
MRIRVLTIFPELFGPFLATSLVGRAIEKGILEVEVQDLRGFTEDRHRSVDDEPYGGGGGMVMTAGPWLRGVRGGRAAAGEWRILLSPQGKRLDDAKVRELAARGDQADLLLMCGRYEGIDERVRQTVVDEEVSIGDYVLSGGELPAMVLIEALSRQVPGVVKLAESVEQDSFRAGLLDYPHYTRPPVVEGLAVPEVLTSGDHAAIRRWREREALRATWEKRPDLLELPGARGALTRDQRRELERLERDTRPGEPATGLRGHSEIANNGGTVPQADAASLRGES